MVYNIYNFLNGKYSTFKNMLSNTVILHNFEQCFEKCKSFLNLEFHTENSRWGGLLVWKQK